MPLIAIPTGLYFTDVDIWADRGSATMRSPFTGKRQSTKRPYDLWRFKGGLMSMDAEDAGPMRSFLMQLEGQLNWFRLPVPGSKYPISKYTGTEGKSTVALQAGKSLSTSGWTPGQTIVKVGDYFNIGEELKVASANIAANGSGVATLSFDPPIRKPVPLNTPIKVREPTVLLSADNDDIARWKVTPPLRHAFQIEGTEHF